MMPHPLKEHLGVGCVTNWYQSMTTTLGLLGLMHESYENIFGRTLRGNTLSYPIPKKFSKPLPKRGMKPIVVYRCFGNLHCVLLAFPNKEVDFTEQLYVLLYSHKIWLPRLR
jgi:hypothetical protein